MLGKARHQAVDALSNSFFVQAARDGWSAEVQRNWLVFNRLNVDAEKYLVGAALPDYWHRVIVRYSKSTLQELLWHALIHPAMLMYLDNIYNRKDQLNENLGREWLELYTLGVNGGYTQADVVSMSRWLTGLGLEPVPAGAKQPNQDPRSVQFGDAFFDARTRDFSAPGLMGTNFEGKGAVGLSALSQWLASHPSTLRHWARYWLTAQTGREPNLTEWHAATDVLKSSHGQLGALQSWFAQSARRSQVGRASPVKTPLHWLSEVLHAVAAGRRLSKPENVTGASWGLAHPLFRNPSPAGYSNLGQSWANSGQLLSRWKVANHLVNWQVGFFEESLSPTELMSTPILATWRAQVGPETDALLRADLRGEEKLSLLMVCPEVMTHEWVLPT